MIVGSISLVGGLTSVFLVNSKSIWPQCDDYFLLSLVVYLAPVSLPTYSAFIEMCCTGKSTLGTAKNGP